VVATCIAMHLLTPRWDAEYLEEALLPQASAKWVGAIVDRYEVWRRKMN
jgi:hypothetical protein